MRRSQGGAVVTAVAIAAITALVCASWLSLAKSGLGLVEVGRMAGLALVPALVVLAARRPLLGLAALVLLLPVAAGLAFGIPVSDMRPGERDFFGPVFTAVGEGIDGFYRTRVPISASQEPEMGALILLAIVLFAGLSTLLLAARRPLLATLVFVGGVGWPATVAATIPGATPLRSGAIVLAAVLLVLLLTREGLRPVAVVLPGLLVGGLVVAASVGIAASSAVAKPAFLESWQDWNARPEPKQVGVRYVWSSSYSGIAFPDEETVVLRVKAPRRSVYWRATTLERYSGVGWAEELVPAGEASTTDAIDALARDELPAPGRRRDSWMRQEVTVEALADPHLVAASVPVRFALRAPRALQASEDGTVTTPEGLSRGARYTAWSYAPDVEPEALARLDADYPAVLARDLELLPGLGLPPFGERGRERAMDALFESGAGDAVLAEHEAVYRRALEVVGDARSPYVVAATLELWFRSQGGFAYTERPEQPIGLTPPLVDFVLRTKEGYCQHFAGAMALMLRLLGIPARVAAGFTSGEYDSESGEWVVTDHNAHTWVEVWFPQFGWLPFDPTPGRGSLGAGYSTTSTTFDQSLQQLVTSGLGLSPTLQKVARAGGDRPAAAGPGPSPAARAGGSGGPLRIAVAVIVGMLVAVGLVIAGKATWRRLRYVGADARGISTACRRELAGFLRERRAGVPDGLTLEELGRLVEGRFGVDASGFVRAAASARFGPPGTAAAAAVAARRELRALMREIASRETLARRAAGALGLRSLAA